MRHLPLDHPGTADHRSPARFLWWLVTGQWRTIVVGMLLGITWMLCQAVMPAVVGRAIDRGVTAEDTTALVRWTGLMLVSAWSRRQPASCATASPSRTG